MPPRAEAQLVEVEQILLQQAEAAHAGDASLVASLGESGLSALGTLLSTLQEQALGSPPEWIQRVRFPWMVRLARITDLARNNQILIRCAFSSWAAARLDKERRSTRYNSSGKKTRWGDPLDGSGQLKKGIL